MRKNKVLFSIMLTVATLAFASCGTGENGASSSSSYNASFVGLTVEESATGELGSYYVFETPDVLYGEKEAVVSITVKSGNQTVPHDNKKVYLDSVQPYVITYTATYENKSESKTTTVTVADTKAPVFVNRLYGAVRNGNSVVISDFIKAVDSSAIQSVSYTATKEDGTALPDGSFDAETNTLCVTDESIHSVKIGVTATDVYNNTDSGEFVIPFSLTPVFGSFDFDWYEKNTQGIGGVSVKTSAQITQTATVEEENGEKYLSISLTTTETNQYVYVQLDKELIGDFSSFDAVDVEMMLDYAGAGANGGNGSLMGSEFGSAPVNTVQNLFAANKGKWFTYRYQGENAQKSIADNQGVYLLFKPWAIQEISIKIKSVTGVYSLPSMENKTFDLLEEFSLAETELKNVEFNGVAVENVTAFKPTSGGVITFDVEKAEHKKGSFSVRVEQPLAYGQVFDFDSIDLNKVTVHKGAELVDVANVVEDGVEVEIVGDKPHNIRFKGVNAKNLTAFDWMKVTYSVTYTDGGNYAFLCLLNGTYGNGPNTLSQGKYITVTYTGGFTTEEDLRLAITNWQSAKTDMTIVVHDIQFGYNGIDLTDDSSSLDLTEYLGLSDTELTNVKFNGDPVVDFTDFTATTSGTLTFDVKKEGFKSTQMQLAVTYTKLKEYQPVFDVENPDMTNLWIESVTAVGDKGFKATGEDENGKYIQTWLPSGQWHNVRFNIGRNELNALKNYDWFTVKIAVYYYSGVSDATTATGVTSGKLASANFWVGPMNAGGQEKSSGQLLELTWNRKDYANFNTLVGGENGMFKFTFQSYMNGNAFVVRFYDIEFGYNDIETDGTTAIDLTSKFNATADEITAIFTPTGGTASEITDKTAWTPTESGVLMITVKKVGFKPVTYTINVNKS